MNLEDLMKKHCKAIGADGLCNPDMECGCTLEDFMPCGEPDQRECIPACRVETPNSNVDWTMIPLAVSEQSESANPHHTLTDAQHDRIKEIVLMACWDSLVNWRVENIPNELWLQAAQAKYLTDPFFFKGVNCTVQRIVEVLESPVRHAPAPPDPYPWTGAQENLHKQQKEE